MVGRNLYRSIIFFYYMVAGDSLLPSINGWGDDLYADWVKFTAPLSWRVKAVQILNERCLSFINGWEPFGACLSFWKKCCPHCKVKKSCVTSAFYIYDFTRTNAGNDHLYPVQIFAEGGNRTHDRWGCSRKFNNCAKQDLLQFEENFYQSLLGRGTPYRISLGNF